jgi:hypothetical protein
MIIDPVLRLPQEGKRDICNIKSLGRDKGNMKTKMYWRSTEAYDHTV